MNNFLVTGGAGFIGSNLCEKLIGKGFRVRVLDNLSTGKEENMNSFIKSAEFIKGDIRDKLTVERAVRGVEYVISSCCARFCAKVYRRPCDNT